MSWLIKHLKLISLLSLFLWGGVVQAQSVKKFGRETQAKFQKLNPYKLGQFKYARPHSILEGRKFRLKLLVPYADTTSYKESATGRKWSFDGYTPVLNPILYTSATNGWGLGKPVWPTIWKVNSAIISSIWNGRMLDSHSDYNDVFS